MNYLFLDFESFYSRKEKMDLGSMSIMAYCRDPRFKVHGLAVAIRDGSTCWYNAEEGREFLSRYIDWPNTVVVGQNVKFDAFILKNTYGIMAGQYIDTKAMSKAVLGKSVKGHSLKDLAEHFGLVPKGQMSCEGVRDLNPEQEAALADYCRHDVWLTREIFKRLKPNFPEGQYALMDWTVRTFVDPKLCLNVPLLKETAEWERADKKAKFEALGIDKKVFSSQDKFSALLASKGYDVPMKPSPKKKDAEGKPVLIPALAMGDVAFLDMLESGDEALRTLCEARRAAKSNLIETRADKLVLIGETGPWAFDIELSGADQTHRMSSGGGSGGNCVTGDTEVLTKFGWRRLDSGITNDLVATWNHRTGEIRWEAARLVENQFSGEAIRIKTQTGTHNCLYTPNHRGNFAGTAKKAAFAPIEVQNINPKRDLKLRVAGIYKGGGEEWPESMARLAAAVQADGSVSDNRIRFDFHKARKVKRLEALLKDLGLEYKKTSRVRHDKGGVLSTRFSVFTNRIDLRPYKYLGPWLLGLNAQSLEWFVDETQHWDSHVRRRSWQYFTADEQNAVWMQTAAHLTGRSAMVQKGPNNGGKDTLFTVNVKPRDYVLLEGGRNCTTKEAFTGKMFCLMTDADGFIARANGAVFVTHNSQNFTRGSALRKAVEAPRGKSLVVGDLANIELRMVAYLSGDKGLIYAIENGIDIYCDFASVFYGRPITKANAKERFFGKTAILGLGYGMGWKKFKKTVREKTGETILDEDAKRAVDLYRKRYSGVTALWAYMDKAIAQINDPEIKPFGFLPLQIGQGGVILPSGLVIKYPELQQIVSGEKDRWGKPRLEWVYDVYDKRKLQQRKLYGGKFLENISQALAGEICKEAACRFLPWLTGLVHDEIHLLVPSPLAPVFVKRLELAMSKAPKWFSSMKLAAEVGAGPNWLESKG